MSRALTYELEDVIADVEQGEVVAHPIPTGRNPARIRWRAQNSLRLARPAAGGDGHDLVFVVAHTLSDLIDHLAALPLVDRAALSAVYVEEIWVNQIPCPVDKRRLLERFDRVFVGCEGSAIPLAEQIGRPVTYLAPSVDLDRFTDPRPNSRPIAVYSMGRRNPDHHEALLRYARGNDVLYLYDTHVGNSHIYSHVKHREKLADLIRRTRYFTVNVAKVTLPGETGEQEEIGYRYFEGAAAGAMMIGARPRSDRFDQFFPWPDAVIELATDGSDVVEVLAELDADPDRRDRASRAAMAHSLVHHDSGHRWRTVLSTLGLDETPRLGERIEALAATSAGIEAGVGTDP